MTTTTTGKVKDVTVGSLLRGWRDRRRISQLELASQAESSARHISFIETGRAKPSQAMVLRLAEHLDVPVRDRNTLLVAAGYAPVYTETPLNSPAMDSLRTGLDRLLTAYEPNPALIMDGTYDILAANRGIQALLGDIPEDLLRPPMNAIRLTLHPQGLATRIRNLPEWRAHLLDRMERQISLRSSPSLRRLYEEVTTYPVPEHDSEGHRPPTDPHVYALPLQVEVEGRMLSFLSAVTTFNTPMDVTVSELAVETFLPADRETAEALRTLAGADAGVGGGVMHPGAGRG